MSGGKKCSRFSYEIISVRYNSAIHKLVVLGVLGDKVEK